jgi:hypothetical protein
MSKLRCLIILSERSSGSSALQNFLVKFTKAQHVKNTIHYEFETLYWTKAASILGKPQINMVDSRVPFKYEQAKSDIIQLLQENLNVFDVPDTDKELILNGWRALCQQFSPVFLEKSPHHLCEWSALELMIDSFIEMEDIDYLIVGLVRNPLDTIYSQFRRWYSIPEKIEKQWIIAYQNLLNLKKRIPHKLVIVRYEDLTTSIKPLSSILDFCGVNDQIEENFFYSHSINKWKDDRLFGFSLSSECINLAKKFGYHKSELMNKSYFCAPLIHHILHFLYRILINTKLFIKKFRNDPIS